MKNAFGAVAVLCTLGVASSSIAENRPASGGDTPTIAETLTKSGTVIDMHVTLTSGRDLRISAHDGQMARLTIDGKTYGLTPAVTDSEAGSADVFLFEITSHGQAGESLRQIDQLHLSRGTVAGGKTSPFSVSVENIGTKTTIHPANGTCARKTAFSPDGGGKCCITCQGPPEITACGCAVELYCGSCCSGDCCP